jgi:hypothetical protein
MPKLDANNLQLRIAGSADLSLLHKGKSERIDELNMKIICSPSSLKGLRYGLKGPKHEIFESAFFTEIRPVRIGDLGTGEKK